MGNYLLSLRVPPSPTAERDERNHPNYYDWSLPKEYLFRKSPQMPTVATEAKQAAAVELGGSISSNSVAGKQSADVVRSRGSNLTAAMHPNGLLTDDGTDVDPKQSLGRTTRGSKMTKGQQSDTKITTSNKTARPTANSPAQKSQSGTKSTLSTVAKSSKETEETKTVVANVSQTGAVESAQSKKTAGKLPESTTTSKTANKTLNKDSSVGQRGLRSAVSEPASGKMLATETSAKRPPSKPTDGH